MSQRQGASTNGYSYVVLAILTIVFTSNFLDRQLLAILTQPVKAELGLSDTQIGLLAGPVFALFYTTFGVPLAWLADRVNRVRIIAISCALWSVFSATCGLAGNFAQLALARIGVAVGEAGGSPPAHSLISDYFPPKRRGLALAVYSLGVAIGPALGAALGGGIAARYGWRTAFFVIGLPGVLLALVVWLFVREPARGRFDAVAGQTAAPALPLFISIGRFFRQRTLVLVAASTAFSAFAGYGMSAWTPAFLMREQGMTLSDIAVYYSLSSGVGAIIGTLASGYFADRLSGWSPRSYSLIPAVALFIALPFLLLALWSPSWQLSLTALMVPQIMCNMFLAPALAVVQNIAAPAQRAISSSLVLFFLNLIGLGGGPLFVGFVSDHAPGTWGFAPLQIGLAALTPIFLIAVALHYATSLSLRRDHERASQLVRAY